MGLKEVDGRQVLKWVSRRWEKSIKMGYKEMRGNYYNGFQGNGGFENVDRIHMAQDGIQRWGLVNMVMNLLQGTLKVEAAGLLQNIGVYLSEYAASYPSPPFCLQRIV